MLYIIGLGLYDEKDVSVRGFELVRRECVKVYLENYTSILPHCSVARLEKFYGKPINVCDRGAVEEERRCDEMLEAALTGDVAFLVVGDPLCATTHGDLILRAEAKGVKFQVVHNASIYNGVAACGLQLYRFGETISLPFFQSSWRPDSWYDRLRRNQENGLHTLCLLDIRVKEQTAENLMRGNRVFEPPSFMTVAQAVQQLLEVEREKGQGVCGANARAFGIARLGSPVDQKIGAGTLEELRMYPHWGPPLHSLVICASELHDVELSFFKLLALPTS